jgi:transposase
MPTPNKYPKEFREKAVRMVAEMNSPDAIRRVGKALGVNRETVRYWVKTAPASKGGKRGLTDAEIAELTALRKEVKELRRANEILKSASAFFAKELDQNRTR